MSSRLFTEGDIVSAVPIAWRSAQGPSHAQQANQTDPTSNRDQLTELQHEANARAQAAYQQGYAAGEAAGQTTGAQKAGQLLEPVIAGFKGVIHELAGMRKRVRNEAEQEAVKLAIAIARRVMHRELATDPDAILGLVIAAFSKMNAREVHRLRVSPAEAKAIEQNRARLDLPAALEIVSDSSLTSGCALFETARGELDASVDTQLMEIERGFTDLMRRKS